MSILVLPELRMAGLYTCAMDRNDPLTPRLSSPTDRTTEASAEPIAIEVPTGE
jgi:hypothetical protein